MKFTVEQVAKLTKLSAATVRVYASRQKLGTREGNKRYFSKADVNKLMQKAPAAGARKPAPTKKRKARTTRPASRPQKPVQKPVEKKAPEMKAETPPKKRSFWSFLRRQPQQKVTLMDAKVRR